MFKPIPIVISNHYPFAMENRPFSIGVPCPEGAIINLQHLKLNAKGQQQQCYITQLANWADGSSKWILLGFQTSIKAKEQAHLQLVCDKETDSSASQQTKSVQIMASDTDDTHVVNTGTTQFLIPKHSSDLSGLELFNQVNYDNNTLLSDTSVCIQLIDDNGSPASARVSNISFSKAENTLQKKISINGFFQNSSEKNLVDFNVKMTFDAGHSTVKCEFTLANPKAAEHPGGLWDLGDKGSFFFKELSVKIQLAKADEPFRSSIKLSPDGDWRLNKKESLRLEQDSSGGENWQSKNHVNFKGEIPMTYKGFRYFEQNVQQTSGDRATPVVHLASERGGVTAHIVDFWQNFPKAMQFDQSTLSLKLFPGMLSDCYELQGGERKKHTFYLDFSNNKTSLDSYINDIRPQIPLDYYFKAKVIPWLPNSNEGSVMQGLIHRGIQGKNNFFDKRETIDEFGWRNFGEIFADHERHEYKGDNELISHYNNQYDPLYGFIKQYLITGDKRWHELLSSLAQHIVDIDIYHTENDRDEYNGALFWHTHHYLTAFTCTHRTFSKHHAADFLYGTIGGGPSSEHCYTTGLSYYYFISGDEVYKEAALQLVHWISRALEGSGAVIERIFQFKSKELPILKRLISGEIIQRYSYPFTRGTGNYISSLIDAYNLTGQRHYLLSIERVIHQSIHPLDDISLRNLDDIELSWSYLIYLQAICKYLDLKITLKEVDEACLYAKDSLLHYVDWMVENESPFLQNPDSLEYPNHTWAAQDLRKANLLFIASLYCSDRKTKYLETAHFYLHSVEDALSNEETRYYSRILILLMQSDIQESALNYDTASILRDSPQSTRYSPAPLYSISGLLWGVFREIGRRLFKLSLKKEWRWLSFRVK